MAVGSWVGSDIFLTLEPFENLIERGSSRLQKGKVKGKGKARATAYHDVEEMKAAVQESDDDTDFEWKGDSGYD